MGIRLRYHHTEGICGLLVLESQPAYRSIIAYMNNTVRRSVYDPPPVARLAFPHIIFVVNYIFDGAAYHYNGIYKRGLCVFLSPKPLVSMDSKVFYSPTDTERGGLVCTPHQHDNDSYTNLNALGHGVVTLWWNTLHNIQTPFRDKWQNMSLEDVLKEREWCGEVGTLRQAIMKDYSNYGYGALQLSVPDDAVLIDEDFPAK